MTRGVFQSFIKSFGLTIITLVLLFSPATQPVLAQTSEPVSETTFAEHHAALKEDTSLQFELAEPEVREIREPRSWGAFGDIIAGLMKLLFYGICAALVLTVLFYVIREFIHMRLPAKKDKAEDEDEDIPLYVPDADAAQILLGDVDQLAGEGKFADAIHTLLFRSIQDIEEKRPHSIRQSFTSREIAELQILTPEARSAFSRIGRVVEEGFFGSRALGKAEFEACREAYVQFTRPKAWA